MKRLIALLPLFIFAGLAVAATPRTMSYQGSLRDSGGAPVPDGGHAFVFTIWSAPADGTALWQESRSLVTDKGLFDVVLGEVTPLDLPFDADYWLAVSVDGEDIAPRARLASSPYALRAAVADSVAGMAGFDDGDWTVSGDDIHRVVGDVGIGTASPAARLDVAGGVRATGLQLTTSPVAGHVLTSDAAGNASWQSPQTGGGLELPYGGIGSYAEALFRVDNGGDGPGLHGVSGSAAAGVLGNSPAGPGVKGSGAVGVRGERTDGNAGELGTDFAGVRGVGGEANAAGVYGVHTPTGHEGWLADAYYGVSGQVSDPGARGVMGSHSGYLNWGYLGGPGAGVVGSGAVGVRGERSDGNTGELGTDYAGVRGVAGETNAAGVSGEHTPTGHTGSLADALYGVFGQVSATGARGVMGSHSGYMNWGYLGGEEAGAVGSGGGSLFGMKALHSSGTWAYLAGPAASGFFMHGGGNSVEMASSEQALSAFNAATTNFAKLGTSFAAVEARGYGDGPAVFASSNDGPAIWAESENDKAGFFVGDVAISTGKLGINVPPEDAIHVRGYGGLGAMIRLDGGMDISGLRIREENSPRWTLLYRTWQNDNFHVYDEVLGDELMTFESNTGCVGVRNENPAYPLDVTGTLRCTTLIETSDGRLKGDVETLDGALDAVTRLRGVRFAWNDAAAARGAEPGRREIGLVAQEVETVLPEVVSTDEDGFKGVDYGKLTAVLINAVQELKAQNERLAERVAELEKESGHGER